MAKKRPMQKTKPQVLPTADGTSPAPAIAAGMILLVVYLLLHAGIIGKLVALFVNG